jgi:hypothetical protein
MNNTILISLTCNDADKTRIIDEISACLGSLNIMSTRVDASNNLTVVVSKEADPIEDLPQTALDASVEIPPDVTLPPEPEINPEPEVMPVEEPENIVSASIADADVEVAPAEQVGTAMILDLSTAEADSVPVFIHASPQSKLHVCDLDTTSPHFCIFRHAGVNFKYPCVNGHIQATVKIGDKARRIDLDIDVAQQPGVNALYLGANDADLLT